MCDVMDEGGSNRILSSTQEKVICEYITRLSAKGELGATRELVYSAICSLLVLDLVIYN